MTATIEAALANAFGVGHAAHVRALTEAVGLLARSIEKKTGARWTKDPFTAQALRVAVDAFLDHFGKQGEAKIPPAIKAAIARMPAEWGERHKTVEGLGREEAFQLVLTIENAPAPFESRNPGIRFPDAWWGPYDLLRDLGSGWQRDRGTK